MLASVREIAWRLARHPPAAALVFWIEAGGGSKGEPPPAPHETRTWWHAVATCLDHCSRCEGCHHISVSLRFADCSWYRRCDASPLLSDVLGFRSGPVPRLQDGQVPPLSHYRPRMQWRRFAIPADNSSSTATTTSSRASSRGNRGDDAAAARVSDVGASFGSARVRVVRAAIYVRPH